MMTGPSPNRRTRKDSLAVIEHGEPQAGQNVASDVKSSSSSDQHHHGLSHRKRVPKYLHREAVEPVHHLPHVLSHYRVNHGYLESLGSVLTLHNQTINIWTHLLGGVHFFLVGWQACTDLEARNAPALDRAVLLFFIGCAVFQMLASAAYHTLTNVSPGAARTWLKIDVVGIIAMIFGSYAAGLYNGFACTPGKALAYIGILAVFLGASAVLCFSGDGNDPRTGQLRNFSLAASVIFGAVPSVQWVMQHGVFLPWHVQRVFLYAALGMFGGYGGGFTVFVLRIPERWFPGKVDLVGHSHHWWHVLVWLAGASWIAGMLEFARLRQSDPALQCGA